jgi:hypothetical protein
MPNYQPTPPPPTSLQPGGIGYSFGSVDSHRTHDLSANYPNIIVVDNESLGQAMAVETGEAIPAPATAGAQFALTQPVPRGETGGRAITYETEFDVAPSTASVSLQGAMRDVESEYVTLDTNAAITVAVASKTVLGVRQLFVRLKLNTITAGSATKIIGKILA